MNIITNIIVFIVIAIIGTPLKIFTKLIQLAQHEDYNFWVTFAFKVFFTRFFIELVTSLVEEHELNFEFWACFSILGIAYITYQVQRKLDVIVIVFNNKVYRPFEVYDRFGEQTLFGVFFVPTVILAYTYNLVMFMTDNPIRFM